VKDAIPFRPHRLLYRAGVFGQHAQPPQVSLCCASATQRDLLVFLLVFLILNRCRTRFHAGCGLFFDLVSASIPIEASCFQINSFSGFMETGWRSILT
jgi:hypothetical protein